MFKELVKKTRSYRTFKSGAQVSHETLLDIVDTARQTSAAMNAQPIKYRLVESAEEKEALLAITRWAGRLSQKLPPKDHEPSAYIVVCLDTSVSPEKPIFLYDVGICVQTIMLAAAEKGLGACIIGSATERAMCDTLKLPENIVPKLIVALGEPDEEVVLLDAESGADVGYYRDENNVHYVPKRRLEDVII